jgi:hypothetical protein
MLFAFAKIQDNTPTEYPIYLGEMMYRLETLTVEETLAAVEGTEYVPVYECDPIESEVDKEISDAPPQFIDGKWRRVLVNNAISPELAAQRRANTIISLREERTNKLKACDWTQVSDSPLTAEKKAEWATYRQALRDVPSQATFPDSIDWPTEPA